MHSVRPASLRLSGLDILSGIFAEEFGSEDAYGLWSSQRKEPFITSGLVRLPLDWK